MRVLQSFFPFKAGKYNFKVVKRGIWCLAYTGQLDAQLTCLGPELDYGFQWFHSSVKLRALFNQSDGILIVSQKYIWSATSENVPSVIHMKC